MIEQRQRLRIVHVVYSFSIGGLENVIVQLINRLPAERYEHIVVSMTTISDFRNRVVQPDVRYIALNKPPGHAVALYHKIYRLLRNLQPDVLHTCSLAGLEIMPIALMAGIPFRLHAEHGWDMRDPGGTNRRVRFIRRLYRPFVHHYVAVSQDIYDYQQREIGIPARRLSLIPNGVDTDRFSPSVGARVVAQGYPFQAEGQWIVGTIGRLQPVKNQISLARAFIRLLQKYPGAAARARLVIVGDGDLRPEIEQILAQGDALKYAWLPGERDDIPEVLRMLDCFVLPSHAEGTSCTLQEAMACGRPVIATAVGGTPKLVEEGVTGHLVQPDDDEALADAMWQYMNNPLMAQDHGATARRRAVANFGMAGLVDSYDRLFSRRSGNVTNAAN